MAKINKPFPTITCPHCGREVPHKKRCPHCGQYLPKRKREGLKLHKLTPVEIFLAVVGIAALIIALVAV